MTKKPTTKKAARKATRRSSADVANTKRRSIAAQVARRGRASTILTEPTEKLGLRLSAGPASGHGDLPRKRNTNHRSLP